MELYNSLDDGSGQASALINIGATYNQAHDSSKALEVLDRALDLAKSLRNKDLEAGSLNAIGRAYANLGDRSRALETYRSALSEYQEVGDREGDADVSRNIRMLSASKSR